MKDFSYIYNADPFYVDSIYKEYLHNPDSVDSSWKQFFYGFDFDLEDVYPNLRFEDGREIGLHLSSRHDTIVKLQSIYWYKIGFKFLHIESLEKRDWAWNYIERIAKPASVSTAIGHKKIHD